MRVGYVDIETDYVGTYTDQKLFTDFANHKITVLGVRILDAGKEEFVQLVAPEISRLRVEETLRGVEKLVTYNGRSIPDAIKGRVGFDFPVIAAQLGVVLDKEFPHMDLVPECWKRNWYGGQKKVEERLGLKRTLPGKDGAWATEAWREYKKTGEKKRIEELLLYNREDVFMLREIEAHLEK